MKTVKPLENLIPTEKGGLTEQSRVLKTTDNGAQIPFAYELLSKTFNVYIKRTTSKYQRNLSGWHVIISEIRDMKRGKVGMMAWLIWENWLPSIHI